LLKERIAIMREVGFILSAVSKPLSPFFFCKLTNTLFGDRVSAGLSKDLSRNSKDGMITKVPLLTSSEWLPTLFPRSEMRFGSRVTEASKKKLFEIFFHKPLTVFLWKRAQILVAETWAAFYPTTSPHPLFPGHLGPAIHHLTMFADYRVPQILHHLRILTYPPALVRMLRQGTPLESGSREEVSIRAASIVAVERIREEMLRVSEGGGDEGVSSVLIDFYLWDLAKKVEKGEETIEGVETEDVVPVHRTRSIWY
jgi:hypothetical protein